MNKLYFTWLYINDNSQLCINAFTRSNLYSIKKIYYGSNSVWGVESFVYLDPKLLNYQTKYFSEIEGLPQTKELTISTCEKVVISGGYERLPDNLKSIL